MTRLADDIAAELRQAGDSERAAGQRAYLKSDLEHWGVRVPEVRRVVRAALRGRSLDGADVWRVAGELWAGDVFERRLAAVEVLTAMRRELGSDDLAAVEPLVRAAGTWALVDPLAIYVAGDVVGRDPDGTAATLDAWAVDADHWVRRSALLALLPGLRGSSGAGDWERFTRYADSMLDEPEFFIRKAIGWVLRETGKRTPERVAQWLAPRTDRASGVTMREAVKYLPAADASRLLAAHRAGRSA